ncbi:hypothetical protein [Idiomarina abyssalis]|uniref:phage tail fiber protein n=1 Tax=Idiomarina abyssalis TaxID=86102 RepID=UPI003A941782
MPFAAAINQSALDHIFQKSVWTPPGNLSIVLSTTTPDAGGGNITQPVGNGYAPIATVPADWTRSGLEMSNVAREDFPEATGSWGTVTHFALLDGATPIAFGALTPAQAVLTGQQPYFNPGALVCRYL